MQRSPSLSRALWALVALLASACGSNGNSPKTDLKAVFYRTMPAAPAVTLTVQRQNGAAMTGAQVIVDTRSTFFPGARVGKRAEVAPGSGVTGPVPAGQRWSGVPATRDGKATHRWPSSRPPRNRRWAFAYSAATVALTRDH